MFNIEVLICTCCVTHGERKIKIEMCGLIAEGHFALYGFLFFTSIHLIIPLTRPLYISDAFLAKCITVLDPIYASNRYRQQN